MALLVPKSFILGQKRGRCVTLSPPQLNCHFLHWLDEVDHLLLLERHGAALQGEVNIRYYLDIVVTLR